MKVPVTPLVRAQAEKIFSPADAATVCAALANADLPLINNNGERVHLALVHLAAGDLAEFRRHLAVAQTDWRDVLVADGLGGENWPQMLAQRGIRFLTLSPATRSGG
jgi:hypothetical protein